MAEKVAKKAFPCEVCGTTFKEKRYVAEHLARSCPGPIEIE
jgi:hypothetical protein